MLVLGSRNHDSATESLITPIDRHEELIFKHAASSTLLQASAQVKTMLSRKLIQVNDLEFLTLAEPKPSIDDSDTISRDSLGDP